MSFRIAYNVKGCADKRRLRLLMAATNYLIRGIRVNEQVWTTFQVVSEVGSFSQAARRLNLSQSAVSQQISLLEQEYQARFFLRSGHGVQLTEAGEVLYRYVNSVLKIVSESREAVRTLTDEAAIPLKVGASMTIAEYVLPRILPAFCHPGRPDRLAVTMANSSTVFEQVRQREVDVGLVEAALSDPLLVVHPFYEDRLTVITAANHPWAGRERVTLEEFMQEPIIVREPGSGTRMTLEDGLHAVNRGMQDLRVVLVLGTTQAIKSMVEAGVGVAALSPLTIAPGEADQFHCLEVEGLSLSRHFSMVFTQDLASATGRAFIRALERLQMPPRFPQ